MAGLGPARLRPVADQLARIAAKNPSSPWAVLLLGEALGAEKAADALRATCGGRLDAQHAHWLAPKKRTLAGRLKTATGRELDSILLSLDEPEDAPGTTAEVLEVLAGSPEPSDGKETTRGGVCLRWLHKFGETVPAKRWNVLRELLASESAATRSEAAIALARVGCREKAVLDLLVETLRSDNDEVKDDAAGAVALFGEAALPALGNVLRYAREAEAPDPAVAALAAVGKPAMPTVLKLLAEEADRAVALRAIIELGPEAEGAVKPLLGLLKADGSRAGGDRRGAGPHRPASERGRPRASGAAGEDGSGG